MRAPWPPWPPWAGCSSAAEQVAQHEASRAQHEGSRGQHWVDEMAQQGQAVEVDCA